MFLGWRETFPIEKEGLQFTLEVRYATEKDVKDPNRKEKSSAYYGFLFEQIREKKEVCLEINLFDISF